MDLAWSTYLELRIPPVVKWGFGPAECGPRA